ncbi:MAG TPA: phosphoribosylformylglycinamidine synthase subunit PurS [Candidatus Bathyarchaeia archaeon]|nr:MAG: phosphoribosylformylglycinamidine synthase, purS protein [Candidatus Bathyarchaeota archaeon RBG_16_48_13]HJX23978.1 phosphoribosylformylglycinamidine synthase subunit PurS [Candidatus Bathyarchaeia archaeon]
MTEFMVEVVIENKPVAKDPEGETIQRDLMNRGGYPQVKKVRSGKYLRLTVEAPNGKAAKDLVFRMFNELRIYNPVVHTCKITVKE